ncbi:hypothetical protein IR120_11965 [Muribacter muris]|nr:hypothetical protein [Muribacter muris]MBF0786163.1 hypothetical protein [Muribacter muris]MBF0828306.1 hypothetical protein [Muribacter muris]
MKGKKQTEWEKFYNWYEKNVNSIIWHIVIIGIFIAALIDVIAANMK